MEPRIIFQYDPEINQYVFPTFPSDRQILQEFILRTHILLSEIHAVIHQVNSCKENENDLRKVGFKYKYVQSMKILFIEVILFLAFLILMISKVYYYKNIKLEIIAIPILIVALILNLIIILCKGKVKFECKRKKVQELPSPYIRNEIFNILHNFTKKNTYGLDWRIMEKGKYLELREKNIKL